MQDARAVGAGIAMMGSKNLKETTMSSINNLSLASILAQQNASTSSSSSSNVSNASLTDSLVAMLNQASTGSSGSAGSTLTDALAAAQGTSSTGAGNASSNDSYLLDLSPEAQAYLSNSSASGAATSTGSATSATGYGIVLSPVQQDKLTAILEKYKDAPYTDTTFQSIQKDMKAAGIGADALAGQSEMRNLSPTAMLLNALSGGDASVGTIGGSADIANMETNFLGQVTSQWQTMSSDYDATTGGSLSTEAAAANDTTAGGASSAS
jgi:hypothetical protein